MPLSAEQEEQRRRFNEGRSFEDDEIFCPGLASPAPPPPPPPQRTLNPGAAPFVPPDVQPSFSIRGLPQPVDNYLLRRNMAALRLPQPDRISCWQESGGAWVAVALYSRQEHVQFAIAAMQSGELLARMQMWKHWGCV